MRTTGIGRQIRTGFAVSLVATILLAGAAIAALERVSATKDLVIERNAELVVGAQELATALSDRDTHVRGFLLTGEASELALVDEAAETFERILVEVRQLVYTDQGRELLDPIADAEAQYASAAQHLITLRRDGASPEILEREVATRLVPALSDATAAVGAFIDRQESLIRTAQENAREQVALARWLFIGLAVAAVASALVIGWWIGSRITRQLRELATDVDGSAAEVASGTGQLTAGSAQQSAAIQQTVATVTELAASADETARRARSVADRAEDFTAAAERGNVAVGDAVEGIRLLREQVDAIAERILELAGRARSISEIVAAVDDITEQTNLLALNAAIEAARAGEHGKGFGVVAGEIRRLADQARGANAQISDILSEIQQATNQAVLATEEGTKGAATGMELIAEAGHAITELAGAVGASADAAEQIAAAAGQQAGATSQIRDAMTEMEQVTQQNVTTARQADATAQQLSRIAERMKAIVGARAP